MSVLTDIEVSIDNCDVQLIIWRLWDKFIHDEIGDMTLLDWNSYCLKHYPTSSYSLKQTMHNNIKERIRFLRIYDLAKTFNLTVNEIELLCNSEYVREVSKMNWFVWKFDAPGYYAGLSTYESAIKYLNTGTTSIKDSCTRESINDGCEIEKTFQYEINKDTVLNTNYNIEKQILCAQVIWTDEFILGFKDYFFNKMEKFS